MFSPNYFLNFDCGTTWVYENNIHVKFSLELYIEYLSTEFELHLNENMLDFPYKFENTFF